MSDQSNDVISQWSQSAPYWEKHAPLVREMFAPITNALIEAAGIGEGSSVIDVAGGTGEPSLTIAGAVGPGGLVVFTDAVAGMVEAARREAERAGLSNISFRQCVADSLPFESDSFDAVVSRLGAMFFPDPLAALGEMLRVVKPEGMAALAVWGDSARNPFFSIVTDVMSRYVESPPEEPDAPGAFRFADPGKLAAIVESAGAVNVREQPLRFRIEAPLTPRQFWRVRIDLSDTLREKVARLTDRQFETASEEVCEAARPFFDGDRISIPAEVIIVTGRKPRSL